MSDELPLAAEFPAATRDDWLNLVRAALKERPFERLTSKTYDGIVIDPLYPRAGDVRPIAGRHGPWQVMARSDHPDPAAANAQALQDLENGATGLALVFPGTIGANGYGLDGSAAGVAKVLDGIYLDAGVAIELHIAETTKEAADHVAALVKSRGLAPGAVAIRFGARPARCACGGRRRHPVARSRASLRRPRRRIGRALLQRPTRRRRWTDRPQRWRLGGAGARLRAGRRGDLLACAGRGRRCARCRARDDRLPACRRCRRFLTIAKFRALRLLWARVEAACGLKPEPAFISAETAWRTMAQRDPWTNMLRGSIAAFAAGVGGADAITVLPFTAALGLPDPFARRIARNIQLLLLEESNIWRVGDPAAGSGGIEDLTRKLTQAAWTLFQEIEQPAARRRRSKPG